MGFTVTPRGYHSSGTINHTIVFNDNYLELLGYPTGKLPEHSSELIRRPIGLVATVLKTDDAEQMQNSLMLHGFNMSPVLNLSRPLDLGNGESMDVKFRVTTLECEVTPGTFLYYCQHLTPELVWRSQWQTHANGCATMVRLIINVNDLKAAVETYQRAVDISEVKSIDKNRCIIRLFNFEIILTTDVNNPWGTQTLVLGTDSLEKVEAIFLQSGINYLKEDQRIFADTRACIGCAIEFESIDQSYINRCLTNFFVQFMIGNA
ncbi:unnamed protein product [Rotaria socialis]